MVSKINSNEAKDKTPKKPVPKKKASNKKMSKKNLRKSKKGKWGSCNSGEFFEDVLNGLGWYFLIMSFLPHLFYVFPSYSWISSKKLHLWALQKKGVLRFHLLGCKNDAIFRFSPNHLRLLEKKNVHNFYHFWGI